jgi:hypothetical protein
MTNEEAYELGKKYIATSTTVVVLSDNSVYLDNDVKYMQDYALQTGKEAFVIKGEVVEPKEVKEAIEEAPTEKKQSKKNK